MEKEKLCFPHKLTGEFSSWVDAVKGLPPAWTPLRTSSTQLEKSLGDLDEVAKIARFADLEKAAKAGDPKTYLRLASAPLRPIPPEEVDKKGLKVARKLNKPSFWSSLKASLPSLKARFGK
jgi:hypothetical protein